MLTNNQKERQVGTSSAWTKNSNQWNCPIAIAQKKMLSSPLRFIPAGKPLNQAFDSEVLRKLCKCLSKITRSVTDKWLVFHHDGAPTFTAISVRLFWVTWPFHGTPFTHFTGAESAKFGNQLHNVLFRNKWHGSGSPRTLLTLPNPLQKMNIKNVSSNAFADWTNVTSLMDRRG